MQTTWKWHKIRYEKQWNRIEDPDMNPHSYILLILTKVSKTYNGDRTASSTNCVGEGGLSACRKVKLDPCLLPALESTKSGIQIFISHPVSTEKGREYSGSNRYE
jgi:hypothetical protein